jgi:hypothetical protein
VNEGRGREAFLDQRMELRNSRRITAGYKVSNVVDCYIRIANSLINDLKCLVDIQRVDEVL